MGVTVQGAIGDVDCDGNTDVAAGGTIFIGNGSSWSNGGMIDGSEISDLGDLNGDGYLDLVTQKKQQPEDMSQGFRVYLNDGSGTGWAEVDAGLSQDMWEPHGLDIADVNGDGRLDIVRWAELANNMHKLEIWVQDS
jgi:hypothetical protein